MKKLSICFAAIATLFFVNCGGVAAHRLTDAKAQVAFTDPSGFVIDPDPNININERGIKAGLLYDADNKKIVWQKDINRMLPIASLTKMMVALLAIEDIHSGKIKWDDMV